MYPDSTCATRYRSSLHCDATLDLRPPAEDDATPAGGRRKSGGKTYMRLPVEGLDHQYDAQLATGIATFVAYAEASPRDGTRRQAGTTHHQVAVTGTFPVRQWGQLQRQYRVTGLAIVTTVVSLESETTSSGREAVAVLCGPSMSRLDIAPEF